MCQVIDSLRVRLPDRDRAAPVVSGTGLWGIVARRNRRKGGRVAPNRTWSGIVPADNDPRPAVAGGVAAA